MGGRCKSQALKKKKEKQMSELDFEFHNPTNEKLPDPPVPVGEQCASDWYSCFQHFDAHIYIAQTVR